MRHRVLIVDDSRATRSFAAAALEAAGDFEINEASSGFEALKLLPQHSFDAVVTDINMPDINGLEVVRFVRANARYRTTPIVIISTEASELDRKRALDLGADSYLAKPFDAAALVAELRRLIARAGGA